MITIALLFALRLAASTAAIDYPSYFAKGTTFADFLTGARVFADEWRETSAHASVEESALARARAIASPRRLLVVADDTCHDSINTVPYLAKLADAAPDMLSMRIVSSDVGQAIKEAHPTPDGRAATPTVVVLDEHGDVKGVFVERPAALLRYVEEHGGGLYPNQVRDLRRRWYAEDKGRHAVDEILTILERP